MDNRKKCRATGKVIFPALVDARLTIIRLKWARRITDFYGKRIKHRRGKPEQKRAYYCSFCEGYHLTKWERKDFKAYQSRDI